VNEMGKVGDIKVDEE